MYGPSAEIHDKITNVRGSFKKTTEAVQALVAQGVSVSAAVIVMKENEAYVDETMQYVRELGMKCSRYDIIRNVRRDSKAPCTDQQRGNTKGLSNEA